MVGYSLVKILSGFVWIMLFMGGIMYLVYFVFFLIVFVLIGLELGVVIL